MSRKQIRGRLWFGISAFLALLTLGYFSPARAVLMLNGAGSTFVYPINSKWFDVYTKVDPEVRFNYQSIGSGGGILQLIHRTVDFGASDAPMSDRLLKRAPGRVLHFPTVLGAVVITYNIPGVKEKLRLTGPVIADIYLGKIKTWNNRKIAQLNPNIELPATPIVVCHRSDGSGTTYIFADYLSKVSPQWSKSVGKGTALKWPVGLGGKGNEGVTALVDETPGAIGYVELIYALNNKLPYASIKNRAGRWIDPSLETVTAAADALAEKMPADFRVSITDAPGENSYPISSYTYLLVYQEQKNPEKGRALVKFLDWVLHDGQKYAPALYYAPLPKSVVRLEEAQLKTIRVSGGG